MMSTLGGRGDGGADPNQRTSLFATARDMRPKRPEPLLSASSGPAFSSSSSSFSSPVFFSSAFSPLPFLAGVSRGFGRG